MALINCPECGKQISDKAPACIHCGFPIELELKNHINVQVPLSKEQEKEWAKELVAIQQNKETELQKSIKLGDEGYATAYANAAKCLINSKDYTNAMFYIEKAFSIDDSNQAALDNMGRLFATKESGYFNSEKSIKCYLKSDSAIAHNDLGAIYSPRIKKDGFDRYWDVDNSIKHYSIAINKGYEGSNALWNIADMYAAYKNNYLIAACYAYLAKLKGSPSATKWGWEKFKTIVEKDYGEIWIDNIIRLQSVKEITPMLVRVEKEVQSLAVKCPYCNSTRVKKLSTMGRFASFSMWGLASSKIGKQWHCNNCNSDF